MYSLLLETGMPAWVTNSFPVIRMVLMIIIGLCALGMIFVTLAQSSEGESGTNVVTGVSYESYYSKNKGGTRDAKLKRATIALALTIAACIIIYFVLFAIYSGSAT